MKKIEKIVLMLAATMLLIVCVGCGTYAKQSVMPDGTVVTQGERTGPFGTDNSFVYIAPPRPQQKRHVAPIQPPEPRVVKLERSYVKKADGWKQKCPNKNQRHSFTHEDVAETWTEEVVVQPEAPVVEQIVETASNPAAFWAGGNPSTGNVLAPATAMAAGMIGAAAVLRPNKTNITNSTSSQGGAGGLGQGGHGGTGGISSSESNAGSASSASAAAETGGNQIGIGIDNRN